MDEGESVEPMACDHEQSSSNPDFSEEDLQGELLNIKGDAIGNTLYSERWVLKTLIRLSHYPAEEEWNEEYEQDMCLLWDMTTDNDVAMFLLTHDGFSVFGRILVQAHDCKDVRLIEIIVGILGNICSVETVRHELTNNEVFCQLVLDLITLQDTMSLIQLVRLCNTCLWELRRPELMYATSRCGSPAPKTESTSVDNIDNTMSKMVVGDSYKQKWLTCLTNNKDRFFQFIFFCLSSSTNEELLCSTLELLETLLQLPDLDAANITATNDTNVQSVIEALQELLRPIKVGDSATCNRKLWRWYKVWGNIVGVITTFESGRHFLYTKAKSLLKCLMKLLLVFTTPEALQTEDPVMVLDCLSILESFPPIEVLPATVAKFITVLQQVHEQVGIQPDNTEEQDEDDRVTLTHLKLRLNTYCIHLLHNQDIQHVLEHTTDLSYLYLLSQFDTTLRQRLEEAELAVRTNGLVNTCTRNSYTSDN